MSNPLSANDRVAADWTVYDTAHLLARAGFGAGAGELEVAHAAGLDATVDRLLTPVEETK